MNDVINIKDNPGFVKKQGKNGIISNDKAGLEAYKKQKQKFKEISFLSSRVEELEKRLEKLERIIDDSIAK